MLVRQVPELYFRGSLANITMANLTKQEKEHLEKLMELVGNHPEMIRHKNKAISKFGVTIAQDYRDDRAIAEEEYNLAIWKGLVDLFYHKKYTFKCESCRSSHYYTKRNKPAPIDRLYPVCPNCSCVKVVSPGSTDLKVGQFVKIDVFQKSFEDPNVEPPSSESPIEYVPGENKYADPYAILNDPQQLKKFFGEFVWNYFRQHIAENKRVELKKKSVRIYDKADVVYIKKIQNLLEHFKSKFTIADNKITVRTYLLPPEFAIEFAILQNAARSNNVELKVNLDRIEVRTKGYVDYIEETILVSEHVSVMENAESDWSKSSGDNFMDYDNHQETVETLDLIESIRSCLPDGDCQAIFDIRCQNGPHYAQFSKNYGDATPTNNIIAEHLGIGIRTVNQHLTSIRVISLAKGLK